MQTDKADHVVVILAKAGTPIGKGGTVTEEALKQLAAQAPTPYIRYREATKDLVWDGPEEAYYEYFHLPQAEQDAETAIKRAMRRGT
jgi:hypothetical protein